jgi:hypothetical protein
MDLVPVYVHRLASYGDAVGSVGERQAMAAKRSSIGWVQSSTSLHAPQSVIWHWSQITSGASAGLRRRESREKSPITGIVLLCIAFALLLFVGPWQTIAFE